MIPKDEDMWGMMTLRGPDCDDAKVVDKETWDMIMEQAEGMRLTPLQFIKFACRTCCIYYKVSRKEEERCGV